MLAIVNFSISLVNYIGKLVADLDLLWWNVLSISGPRVEKWNIVFVLRTHVDIFQNFLKLPRAVVQI